MADMITRCPKCSTAFRISESMITSAKGMVRCGSCLNVFNAKEHLSKQKITPSKTKPKPTSTRPMSQVIDDLEQLAKASKNEHKLISKEAATPAEAETKLKKPKTLQQPQKSNDEGTLFERPTEPENQARDNEAVDEAWALELLKEDSENDSIQIRKVVSQALPVEETQKKEEQAKTPKKTTQPQEIGLGVNIEPEMLIDTIAPIEPESLDSILDGRKASLLSRASWALATVATLTVLIGQIGWLQFHRLNQVEPYRTAYSTACTYLHCQLPEMSDHNKIQASNLLIRSHPKANNALLVDVILKNSAPFEQAFPNLRLTFTNLRNKPIATRKLSPKEYLGGELAGQTMMPIKQAIHIGLEIVDPGDKAVSYSINIEN